MASAPGEVATIDDVLTALDDMIDEGVGEARGWTIFAALYRRMTRAVKRALDDGAFDDGPRMSWFDAVFARRYFTPLRAHRFGGDMPRCWAVAFEGSDDPSLTAMQHLLLGVNAHINLDLGFSVLEAGLEPAPFRRDFERINQILAQELDRVQSVLDQVSPWLDGIDRLMGGADERLGVFVLVHARAQAWRVAIAGGRRTAAERRAFEAGVDTAAEALGRRIAEPRLPLALLVRAIRWREFWTVPQLVELLDDARAS